ncbi:MAG: sigma 54-interacting transcriptional regulator [Acidobacteria bacterium]|jgi:transcriptional regulator with PAS, ATPase and Fis domain|nr:sigma 54-interacting transcriptional regulator [Acidobacteriota bacterium]
MIKEIFRDIVDNTLEGIIIIDNDYRIAYMNHVAGEITGFSNQEASGKHCYEILRAKRCKDYCPIKRFKVDNPQDEIIMDILARDNSEKYIKAKVIKARDYWVEIFNDCTREIELEKRVKEKYIFHDIITQDKGLIEILNQFPRIASSLVPVLLEGESGVGKEVFASAIQAMSKRKDYPFVKLNCAALPETLLESELFGYKKGAFTDARKDKPGLFILADKGTLFLDEIGEMSMVLQAKLLRAVETGEIIPLGAVQPEKVNVRLLAATNKDLFKEVRKGSFREDLFYRLNVVNLHIPPLRERKNDIPLFLNHFLHHFNVIQKKKVPGFSPGTMEILLNYHYPGNVRELRNIIEYAFIFCSNNEIQSKHLPKYLFAEDHDRQRIASDNNKKNREWELLESIPGQMDEEKAQILAALKKSRWNKQKAAQSLNINRSTLWRKIKKYNDLTFH